MSRVVSVHEYELAEGVDGESFERVVSDAESRDLFDLPGLVDYRFLRGIKGPRTGRYTALWCYESREAWRDLWGPPDDPVPPAEYPERWREWESLLDPLLADDPDEIWFTSYEEL